MKFKTRNVIAKWNYEGGGWLVMWPSGRVDAYATSKAVIREIRRINATCTKRGFDAIVTTIEWHTAQAGLTAPKAK